MDSQIKAAFWVLPFGPDKDQLELLRIKKKKKNTVFHIYPSPMFVWRDSHPSLPSSLVLEFELKTTKEKLFSQYACKLESLPPHDLLWVRCVSVVVKAWGVLYPVNIIGWAVGFIISFIKYCFHVYRICEEANRWSPGDGFAGLMFHSPGDLWDNRWMTCPGLLLLIM